MKKCFAFLLTLVLTLSLTACGSESRQLVGAWHGSILPGITQKLNSVVSDALGTEYTSEQEADLWLNAVFNKDGTFTISMDEDATAASLIGYMEALRPTIVELCYQEAEKQGMTREEYDKALEASDLTVEGLVDTILSALDPAALLGAIGEWFISEYTGEIPDAVKDVVAAVNASKARIAEMEAEKATYKAEPVVEEETIGVKVCPVCGAVSEDKFCPHCGAPMGD